MNRAGDNELIYLMLFSAASVATSAMVAKRTVRIP